MTFIKYCSSIILLILPLLFSPSPTKAEGTDLNLPPKLEKEIIRGLNLLFSYRFEEATETYQKLSSYQKDHPLAAFALASAHWWRLSIFVLEPDEGESQPFLDAIAHCIRLSKDKISRGDPTGEGHLALGGALGLWGRWEATNRNWMAAYFKGKKAYKILKRAEKINPKLYDIYMGLGIFDYYIATLPGIIRVLAFLGVDADKEKGIQQLNLSAERSFYARIPSKLFLVDIYANIENKPEKSIELLKECRSDYPTSPFMNLMEVISLYNIGDTEALRESANQFIANLSSATYHPSATTQGYFSLGLSHFKLREWNESEQAFDKAIKLESKYDAFYVFSILIKGYINDLTGRREAAKELYKTVLSNLRRWNSHDNAKQYLKKPFTIDDPQLIKIKL